MHCHIRTAGPGNHLMKLLGVWDLRRLWRNTGQRQIELHVHYCTNLSLFSVLLHLNPVLGHITLPELDRREEQEPPPAKLVLNKPLALHAGEHNCRGPLVLRQPRVFGQQRIDQPSVRVMHGSPACSPFPAPHLCRSVLASVSIRKATTAHAELFPRPHMVHLLHHPVQQDSLPPPEALDQADPCCCPPARHEKYPFRLPTIQASKDDRDNLFSRSQNVQQFDSEL
mmetsp:Transcript_21929/g.48097  ORF Transcript_21929/g.48097 Transcript_21929/m.48097 type:complete len:226 (-) Transcript_21929:178-855(-)